MSSDNPSESVRMSMQDAVAYLYASTPVFHQIGAAAYKPGLERMYDLLARMGNPHLAFRAVHVAGTNGKGSTSHLMAAALVAAGLRVGLFTSPHLVDIRERIRVMDTRHHGKEAYIAQDYFASWVEKWKPLLDEIRPSFFETITAMAFCYFADCQIDIAVVECGLGGRLDSTNVVNPILTIITNIGMDHTEFLGTTLPQIAAEKAGIIKPRIPCIIGETNAETEPVFRAKAEEQNSPILFADSMPQYPPFGCDLSGPYQQKNMQTFYVAYQQLQTILSLPELPDYQLQTDLCGRWQVVQNSPLTICDTGHNSHGIRTYVSALRNLAAEHRDHYLRIVFGMVADKDVDAVLSLLPIEAFYYWTEADSPRAIPSAQMRALGLNHGLIGEDCGGVEQALRKVFTEADAEDVVFIGGSNYVVGAALAIIQNKL